MSKTYDNNGQYSKNSILRYEKIFGKGFVSTGGLGVVKHICNKLQLPANPVVLDIGSGLGGAAFYLAQEFDAQVLGIDLSDTMVNLANERAAENNTDKVSFQLANILEIELPSQHFDLIWSRDALLHIADKESLFTRMHQWLKPNGQFMITDYAQSQGPHSEGFQRYVKDSGYYLHDVESYGDIFRHAGFSNVSCEDWSSLFTENMVAEMHQLQQHPEQFLQHFSQKDLEYLLSRWEQKLGYCQQGDMRAGLWQGRR